MPRGDGTGPLGSGRGDGTGKRGRGRGGGFAQGPGGSCICPLCRKEIPHEYGKPCNLMRCPECGSPLTRKIPA